MVCMYKNEIYISIPLCSIGKQKYAFYIAVASAIGCYSRTPLVDYKKIEKFSSNNIETSLSYFMEDHMEYNIL